MFDFDMLTKLLNLLKWTLPAGNEKDKSSPLPEKTFLDLQVHDNTVSQPDLLPLA